MLRIFVILVFINIVSIAQQGNEFIKGVDISYIPQIEDLGGIYNVNGIPEDPVEIFKQNGINYIRLRLWHTPSEKYNGLASTIEMAKRIKQSGLKFLLNFHYSDWWADPSNQNKPAAWKSISFENLVDSIYSYTFYTLQAFDSVNALPDMIQIGNEIAGGFLWDDGKVNENYNTPQQWQNFTNLLKSAVKGIKDAVPDTVIPIMIHIEHGADNTECRWFFDQLNLNQIQFDIIGLSYYPWWQGTLTNLSANLNDLAARYNKDIIVVEIAYPWTLKNYDNYENFVNNSRQLHTGYPATVMGQYSFISDLNDIIRNVPGKKGKGVFYWAPEYISIPAFPSPWENLTLFNFQGKVLKSIEAFNDSIVPPCPLGIISYWKLDENSGNTFIDELGMNDAVGNMAPLPVSGQVAGAQQFNGSTTKIDVPANSSFDFGNKSNFSVEFWYKGSSIPSTVKAAVGRYISSTGAKWWVGLNANDGKARFYISAGGRSAAVNGTVITDGNWHHVTATRNGLTGSIKIYVDGLLKASSVINPIIGFASSSDKLNIGWFSFQSIYTLDGNLDELAIYNAELSASEILQHYNKTVNGSGYCRDNPVQSSLVIISDPVTSAKIGQQYTYDVNALGEPAPVYTLITYPVGMKINSQSGLISWMPSEAGKFAVTVEITNGINLPVQQSFKIAVSNLLVCPQAMKSYWKLDETSGNIFTDELNMNNASAVVLPVPISGQIGGAQQFNGSTTKLNVSANPSFDFGNKSSFSVEFWYKGSSAPSTVKAAVGRYISSTGAKWWVGLNANDGKARFYMSAGGKSAAVNGSVITDGKWHHVTATRNGTTGSNKIYVDGVLKASSAINPPIGFTSATDNLNIGWFSFQSVYALNGALDEVAIYSKELSSSEIQQNYNNGLAGLAYCEQPVSGTRRIDKLESPLSLFESSPLEYKLFQNYPNPFNPSTVISYQLSVISYATLKVYDVLGNEVAVLVNTRQTAGEYEVRFSPSDFGLSSGVYFYRLTAGDLKYSKKMMFIK